MYLPTIHLSLFVGVEEVRDLQTRKSRVRGLSIDSFEISTGIGIGDRSNLRYSVGLVLDGSSQNSFGLSDTCLHYQ